MRPIIVFALVAVVIAGPLMGIGLYLGYPSANEAEALWVVEDVAAPNADLVSMLRVNLSEMVERVPEQAQPPLYFFALEAWTLLFGGTLFVARVLSLICALLATVVMVKAAQQRHSRDGAMTPYVAGLLALLGVVYPATQAYVYGLLLLWMALATWALLRWARRPSLLGGVVYTLCLTLIFYTAHVLIFVVVLHGLYALRYGMLRRYAVAVLSAGLVFAPWLLFLQTRTLPDFLQTTVIAVAVIASVPLIIELTTWVIQQERNRMVLSVGAGAVSCVIAASLLLSNRFVLPDYINDMQRLRTPDEPMLIDFTPREPLRYLNAQAESPVAGLSVNLGWRDVTPATLASALDAVQNAESLWLMLSADAGYITQLTQQLEVAGWDAGYTYVNDLFVAEYSRPGN
jgi:hypothetical protein